MSSLQLNPKLEPGWLSALSEEFKKPYRLSIKKTLLAEKQAGTVIYPPAPLIFSAFNLTPFDSVKVVILGQDPYHGPGQAHGLCFSVQDGVAIPPSLINIFKEIRNDPLLKELHSGSVVETHPSGDLSRWAKQGVFLLNSILTVKAGLPASHQHLGWQQFTDAAIRAVSEKKEGIVFLLWGRYAISKSSFIDNRRHLLLTAPHPSPLSASRGFFGCRHFSKANEWLVSAGKTPIDWS